jgi:uncharacterized membrane protein
MTRRAAIILFALMLLVLALLGWAVEGGRWVRTGSRDRRSRLEPAFR